MVAHPPGRSMVCYSRRESSYFAALPEPADGNLSASATALLVAVPVLLGSLARLPVGMLTDRFGGRIVFTAVLLSGAAAAWLVPQTSTYQQLIGAAFLLGIAGSSFAVGAAFVSRWTP